MQNPFPFDNWIYNREHPVSVVGEIFTAILLLEPFPREVLIWRKGDKEIRVKVLREIRGGYRGQVIGWEWKEIDSYQ